MLLTFSALEAQQTLQWTFFHPIRSEWIDLGESGSVQEALIRTGELPDPFYGLNEEKFGWIEDHEWKFKAIFFIDSYDEKQKYSLDFGGIDTYAKLLVNGKELAHFENAFIPYHLELNGALKQGANEIDLIFTPPVLFHKERWETERYHLPAPNDVHKIAIAPYTRKPQYQFGWDWSLRMNTIGLIGPARISKITVPEIWNKTVRVDTLRETYAELSFAVELKDKSTEEIEWKSELFGTKIVRKSEDGFFWRKESVQNPALWWPRGLGEQNLYSDEWIVVDQNRNQSLVEKTQFGIKTSELIQEKDEWGTSYYFKINGKRIFGKGADYIPQDIFPDRVNAASIREMVEEMAESNFNMVRVWGGGYYPDEVFFQSCDELGIMVWQDFMFACAMYPGDSSFLANVEKEFDYHVPRISAHPSVVLFNGNNEVEVAWGNWGFQIKYGLYGKAAQEIEQAYTDLFKGLAPKVVSRYSSLPYIHTSPLSNWGKEDFYNHGSQHYWGVWHGKDPIEDFGKKIGRFNAEYGFQSFPEYNTLRSFSTEADWDIHSAVMKQHQKSYVGNDMILKHAKRLYGMPKDFKTFVYYSQLTQSMAVSMAIAGHRIDAPRCGGTIYWQLNDCWPVSSWSSRDYYGNWKALQYSSREDYRELAILEKFDDLETRSYYIVSDSFEEQEVSYSWEILRLDGKVEEKGEGEVQVYANNHAKLDIDFPHYLCKKKKERSHVLSISIDDGKEKYTRTFNHLKENWEEEIIARKVCLELQNVDLNTKTAELVVTTDAFLADLWIVSSRFKVRFEDNFFSMLPGSRTIQISFEDEPKREDFDFYYR